MISTRRMYCPGAKLEGRGMPYYGKWLNPSDHLSEKPGKLAFPRLLSNFSTAQEPVLPSWKILTQTLPSPLEPAGARYATSGYIRDASDIHKRFTYGLVLCVRKL